MPRSVAITLNAVIFPVLDFFRRNVFDRKIQLCAICVDLNPVSVTIEGRSAQISRLVLSGPTRDETAATFTLAEIHRHPLARPSKP